MYLDLSVQKFASIIFIFIVMFAGLLATGTLKESRYGSTPPFASIELALREIGLRFWYGLESSLWRGSQMASAGFALFTNKKEFSRENSERAAHAIPVLTYHRIVTNKNDLNNVTVANFRDQMLTLKKAGWETITLKEYEEFLRGERELSLRSFLITFDDGAKESFYPVDPLFAVLGYEGVIYIIASAAHTQKTVYYLSPVEIQRMLRTGRWEIGSHSYDGHRPYPADAAGNEGIFFADKLWIYAEKRLETDAEFERRVRDDLTRARKSLEAEYGVEVNSFAFPLGNETGIEGAANFAAGASITERVASEIYGIGFLQTNNQQYTFNAPQNGFISRRIHVDHDWDGDRLLTILENGLQKELPLRDDFSENHGWIPAWGTLDLGRNNMELRAEPTTSSASAFLDGSAQWDNYSYDASLNWQNGSVFLLADVTESKSYNSCAFSEGFVRVQSTKDGETRVLAEMRDERIVPTSDARLGIRVHDAVVECTWNYESIVEAYERTSTGGIGMQVWNPELGTASLQVSEILVRPYATSTPNDL